MGVAMTRFKLIFNTRSRYYCLIVSAFIHTKITIYGKKPYTVSKVKFDSPVCFQTGGLSRGLNTTGTFGSGQMRAKM